MHWHWEHQKQHPLGLSILLIANLAAAPAIVYLIYSRSQYYGLGLIIISPVVSVIFQLCDSGIVCVGGSGDALYALDAYFSYFMIVVAFMSVLFLKPFQPPWVELIDVFLSSGLLVLVLWHNSTATVFFILPAGMVIIAIVIRLLIHKEEYRKHVRWTWFGASVFSLAIAETATLLAESIYSDVYWILHSIWQIAAYLSVFFAYRSLVTITAIRYSSSLKKNVSLKAYAPGTAPMMWTEYAYLIPENSAVN